jgi:RimJ/RimL family protein N-acetyltransferase
MARVEIRKLTVADAAALWKLRRTALETEPRAFSASPEANHTPNVEAVAEQLSTGGDDSFVIGAFDHGELVGMAGLHREQRPKLRHKAQVWGVFVLGSHRGKKIGREMIESLIASAREVGGLRQLRLSVAATQQAARGLYVALGFRSFGVEPEALWVDGTYIDEEHFYLLLS